MKKIFKRIGLIVAALAVMSFATVGTIGSVSAAPADPKNAVCNGAMNAVTGACDDDNLGIDSIWGWVGTITTWLLTAVGVVCVIFIIIGGVKYATSGGDADKVKSAKNTLLYALIGLGVALLAGIIVNLVTNVLVGNDGIFS